MKTKLVKRAFTLIVALVALLSLFVFGASATEEKQSGDFTYVVQSDKTVKITQYNGGEKDVTIPSKIGGMTVSAIGTPGFDSKQVKTVTIPKEITSIEKNAFYFCRVTAFKVATDNTKYSSDEYGVLYNKNKNSIIRYATGRTGNEYIMPDSVTSIEEFAFLGTSALKKITFSKNLSVIGAYAFEGTGFETLVIPATIKTIEEGAFNHCSVKELYLEKGIEEIGQNAFYACENVNVYYSGTDYEWRTVDVAYSNYILHDINVHRNASYPFDHPANYTGKISGEVDCEGMITMVYTCTCGDSYIDRLHKPGHFGGKSTCQKKAVCDRCGKEYGSIGMHSYTTVVKQATFNADGSKVDKCKYCGLVDPTFSGPIPRLKTIKLSTSEYIYDGTKKTPTVIVLDREGCGLSRDLNYTVTYESGRKNPGKYTVKVTFIGNYSGSKTLNYTIAPKTVTKLTATQSMDAVRLNWSKVTGASGYGIYQYIDKAWKRIATVTSGSTLTYRVSKLKSGTVYKFKVRAYTKDDGTIWGTASDTIAVSTKPAVPAKVSVTQTQTAVTLKWGKVTGANGYAVFQYTSGKWKRVKTITSPSTVNFTVKNLKSATAYKFRIKAYKKYNGDTLWSAATPTITATTKPTTPKNVSASQTETAITLKWNKVSNVNGYAVFQYISGKWKRVKTITSPSTVSCTVKNLKSGGTYKFRIKAYKKADGKTYWSDATPTITAVTKPAKVTPVVKSSAPGQITLTWKAASGAKLYRVYYKVNDGKYKLYKTYSAPQTLTFKNLNGGDKYTFAIRAEVTAGNKTVLSDVLAKSVKVTYRTTRYLNTMKSGTYYTRYKVSGVEFAEAIKGNMLYTIAYDENGEQNRMVYNGSQGKWYCIYDQYKAYVVINDFDLPAEVRGSELIKAVKNQKIPASFKSTKEEINGKTMFCETARFDDCTIKYCYNGTTLERAYLDMDDGLVVVQVYEEFTNKVPDSLFTIPSDYQCAN